MNGVSSDKIDRYIAMDTAGQEEDPQSAKAAYAKSSDSDSEEEEEEVAAVEMILETYFMQCDNTYNKLQTLCKALFSLSLGSVGWVKPTVKIQSLTWCMNRIPVYMVLFMVPETTITYKVHLMIGILMQNWCFIY